MFVLVCRLCTTEHAVIGMTWIGVSFKIKSVRLTCIVYTIALKFLPAFLHLSKQNSSPGDIQFCKTSPNLHSKIFQYKRNKITTISRGKRRSSAYSRARGLFPYACMPLNLKDCKIASRLLWVVLSHIKNENDPGCQEKVVNFLSVSR